MYKIRCGFCLFLIISLFNIGILFGGTWKEIYTTDTPSTRQGHASVYDIQLNNMIVFGDTTLSDDKIYGLNFVSKRWYVLVPSTDTVKRYGQSAVYDTTNSRMVVFGGYSSSGLVDTTYYFNSNTLDWNVLVTSGTPPSARSGHSAIYDSVHNWMIIFGGKDSNGSTNDLFYLDFNTSPPTWARLTTSGSPPTPRTQHSAIYDSYRKRMVVFGGLATGGASSDVYLLDLVTLQWSRTTPSGTIRERIGHTAVYDPDADKMIVFGGTDLTSFFNDTYALSFTQTGTAWEEISPGLDIPPARSSHSAVYDSKLKRMVIFGGFDGSTRLNDTQEFSQETKWPTTVARDDAFNYPNPFNPEKESTHIRFYISQATEVKIKIYSLIGELVKEWQFNAEKGVYEGLNWDGKNGEGKIVESGGYICLIEKNYSGGTQTNKFKIAVVK